MSEPGLPQRLKDKVHKVHAQDGCRGLLQQFNMAQDIKSVVLTSMAAARKCIEEEEEVRPPHLADNSWYLPCLRSGARLGSASLLTPA